MDQETDGSKNTLLYDEEKDCSVELLLPDQWVVIALEGLQFLLL